jgi:hypothetical protein
MTRFQKWKRRGIGLLVVLTAVTILALFSGAILLTTVRTLHAVSDGEKLDKARYAAFSGIQTALSRLNAPDGVRWSHCIQQPTAGAPSVPPVPLPSELEDLMLVTFRGDADVSAVVGVYNNSLFCPQEFRSPTAPDGTAIPEGSIYISATGIVKGKKKLELTTVGALLNASGYTFENALFSDGELRVTSGVIDSFDSTKTTPPTAAGHATLPVPPEYAQGAGGLPFFYAPYLDPTQPATNRQLATPLGEAKVGSNTGIKVGAVAVPPGGPPGSPPGPPPVPGVALVDGDGVAQDTLSILETPPDGDLLGATKSSAEKSIPKTFVPAGATPLTVPASGPIVLQPGTAYVIDGGLTLDGREVTVAAGTGAATIFVNGKVDIKNSSLNLKGVPKSLQIYVVDDPVAEAAGDIKLEGTKGSFLMAGGSAEMEVTGQCDIFGALMAKKMLFGGDSKLHYDKSIGATAQGKTDFELAQTFSGTSNATATVQEIQSNDALPPPDPVPPGGCGCCGGCGCLMAETQCL